MQSEGKGNQIKTLTGVDYDKSFNHDFKNE